MIELTIQTPTYMFAAVNLLLLAYFNRFHALSSRIRDLASKDRPKQVRVLRKRLGYIRGMLISGLAGVALALLDIVVLLVGSSIYGVILFSLSVGLVLASMIFAVLEIAMGVKALDEELYIHSEKQSTYHD
jgi:hypothetical protein